MSLRITSDLEVVQQAIYLLPPHVRQIDHQLPRFAQQIDQDDDDEDLIQAMSNVEADQLDHLLMGTEEEDLETVPQNEGLTPMEEALGLGGPATALVSLDLIVEAWIDSGSRFNVVRNVSFLRSSDPALWTHLCGKSRGPPTADTFKYSQTPGYTYTISTRAAVVEHERGCNQKIVTAANME